MNVNVEDIRQRVEKTLDYIRPYLQSDGGDVELVNVSEDGVVEVHLQGACQGCPASTITLAAGIERVIREEIPEVTEVVAV